MVFVDGNELYANHFQPFVRSLGTCSIPSRALLNTGEQTKKRKC